MTDKNCNGHYCQGTRRPLSEFYIRKSGPRKGELFSECIKCSRWRKTNYAYDSDPFGWSLYLEYIAERNKPDMTPPDPRWWVWTGMEWLPRYGDEMLGADF